ncbi:hypothetical protein AI2BBH_07800 [Alistipes indistinctus]|nr:hypothetical protein AI2BBH_07800 [Alistipes indistinctus]
MLTRQDLRSWFSKLIDKNRDQIQRNLTALPSKERLQVLEKFMQYTIPKMQNAEAKLDLDKLRDEQIDQIVNELAENL